MGQGARNMSIHRTRWRGPMISSFRPLSHQSTVCETALPPISGLLGARGSCHRPSLNRVENVGQLTLSRETVVQGSSDTSNSQRFTTRSLAIRETWRGLPSNSVDTPHTFLCTNPKAFNSLSLISVLDCFR
jgi:hypothetical protein